MRINHCGEVCAQALYNGQALTAKNPQIKQALAQASKEETEHLAWCEKRIHELGSHTSLLNPLWYAGSFTLGALAGAIGDKWNLGFLAETERQVGAHLDKHLKELPSQDEKSRAILAQMKIDEAHHADTAVHLGAAELPQPIKSAMQQMSKVMTATTYHL
jgi:ubiquinone biosynthesis monooxygenase Coq7